MNSGQRDAPRTDQEPEIAAENQPPRARLGGVLRAAVVSAWERLGLVLAVSLTWSAALSLPVSLERWLPRGTAPAVHLLVLAALPFLAVVSDRGRLCTGPQGGIP